MGHVCTRRMSTTSQEARGGLGMIMPSYWTSIWGKAQVVALRKTNLGIKSNWA